MDDINYTNINSISVCELNTKFNERCYVDWSRSNLISIVTVDGIYILKPQLEVQHGPFKVELIRNPAHRFKHKVLADHWPSFDAIWPTLDNLQYMEVFLDPALTANVDTLSLDLYPRLFRLAKWSPLIDIYPRQCLLATLTVDYQLLIFGLKNDSWVIQADLSCLYDDIWAQIYLNQNLIANQDFETLRRNLHSLSFCNICWKEGKHDGLIILTATINGDIVVWWTHSPHHSELTPASQGMQFFVKLILQTNLEYISSMHLHENLLIVAARDGQVVLYDLTGYFLDLEEAASTNNKALKLVPIPPTATLWHRDNIEVSDFYIELISKDTFRIVLAKSTNICWCIINYTKGTDVKPATLAISDSFSAIDGKDPDVSLHQTPATWLKPAGDRRAVFIADDGSFFQLEFIDDRQDASPEFNAVRTGRVDLSSTVPRGLCTSPKGHLIMMISSISLIYEPAKILSPTKLLLLPTVNEKRFFDDCFEKLFDERWLASNMVKSPMDVCDRIDYIRCTYSDLTSPYSCIVYKAISKAIEEVGVPKNDTQLVKLKIAALLMSKLLEHGITTKIEKFQQVDLDEKVYDMILLYNIGQILSDTLTTNADKKEKIFDVERINSIRNFFAWLDKTPEGKHLRDQYNDNFKLFNSKYADTPSEVCPICQSNISFTSSVYGTCINQHKFDRCARSLLILNLQKSDELVCDICKRHFMLNVVWPTRNLWLCSYCQ